MQCCSRKNSNQTISSAKRHLQIHTLERVTCPVPLNAVGQSHVGSNNPASHSLCHTPKSIELTQIIFSIYELKIDSEAQLFVKTPDRSGYLAFEFIQHSTQNNHVSVQVLQFKAVFV